MTNMWIVGKKHVALCQKLKIYTTNYLESKSKSSQNNILITQLRHKTSIRTLIKIEEISLTLGTK